jgi:hypothetical protein
MAQNPRKLHALNIPKNYINARKWDKIPERGGKTEAKTEQE